MEKHIVISRLSVRGGIVCTATKDAKRFKEIQGDLDELEHARRVGLLKKAIWGNLWYLIN